MISIPFPAVSGCCVLGLGRKEGVRVNDRERAGFEHCASITYSNLITLELSSLPHHINAISSKVSQ